ncbi:hypothetical protein TSOC_002502 [Tetrabaena socialis]|uniref:Uncharacterized protein n=1 Tax=Tetrabaena socialis TaxID=47790 RepID=A0A2J8ADW3_9CHLO|nr:hypothetical protein TSOC_002502 [Tetrabaena socialis]|eukprot:PNH10705.1 hypothetical protein TSOC_002502 [Tetrabaena socialis]
MQRELRGLGCPAPAYVVRGPGTTEEQQRELGFPFGVPALLDIAQAGVAMHAPATIYTNLAAAEHLGAVLRRLRAPAERGLSSLLPAGLQAMVAERVEPPPLVPVHIPGQRLEALPAGLAAPPLRRRSTGLPCHPGVSEWGDIMGHTAGVAAGLEAGMAVVALRDAVAPPTLVCVLAAALALQRHYVTPHDMQTLPERLQRPAEPLGGWAPRVEEDEGEDEEESWGQEEAGQPLCADVWGDEAVIEALRAGGAGSSPPGGDAVARRVARRAAHYRWNGSQLLRAMPGGRSRVCPPPDSRRRLVEMMHGRLGHLGVRRTLALLQGIGGTACGKTCRRSCGSAARAT